ncbi:MAG TPA: hypothetical protein VK528_00775 [Flavobacterium sp.]|nr:hypothetical protein [Flavobacterium sp.]
MKKLLILILLIGFLFSSCSDDNDEEEVAAQQTTECIKNTTTRNRQINGFDFNNSSEFYNQVVANFRFTQNSDTFAGGNCPSMECRTTLTIQNLTNKKMIFGYNIMFNLNFANWNYEGFVTIPAGQLADVGLVSNGCASIDLGSIYIQSTIITYE